MKKIMLIVILSLAVFIQGCSLANLALSAATAYGLSKALE